jgi:Animal haem peroxidase
MKTGPEDETRRYSRRGFLRRAGAGAGAVALSGSVGAGIAPRAAAARSATVETSPTTFGRLFSNLRPFAAAADDVKAALVDLGKRGGLVDAADDLAKGPILLITDLSLSANKRNNPTHTAGTTFFSQFVDHDITFDVGSTLGVPTEPVDSVNSRSPSLDLDSVYGAGPVASSPLYDPADRDKLRIGFGGLFEDLPRVDDGANTAIVADPCNDEQMMIAGLQCAFILFHNNAVDWARNGGYKGASTFSRARKLTTWHYHWLVVHEFLPQIVGQAMVDDVLRNGRRFYRPRMRKGFIPVEFQAGAYRFGHSMVRPSYRISRETLGIRSLRWSSIRPARVRGIRSIFAAVRAPLHRLADVLRLRRRERQAEQADRHEDLDAAVRFEARCDREPRPSAVAAAAEPTARADVEPPVRTGRSSCDRCHTPR